MVNTWLMMVNGGKKMVRFAFIVDIFTRFPSGMDANANHGVFDG